MEFDSTEHSDLCIAMLGFDLGFGGVGLLAKACRVQVYGLGESGSEVRQGLVEFGVLIEICFWWWLEETPTRLPLLTPGGKMHTRILVNIITTYCMSVDAPSKTEQSKMNHLPTQCVQAHAKPQRLHGKCQPLPCLPSTFT